MSNPANRLASFRSYSYYHVLVMCDTTETAFALAESQLEGMWDHATPDTEALDSRPESKQLGKFSPRCVGHSTTAGETVCTGRYIVLINGSTDAAFSITKAAWSSATAANAVKGDGNTSLAVEGSISISEPKGIAFLDQVVQCSVALGVDSSQLVYCLKTFFVGYEYDVSSGASKPTLISDITPVVFTVYDVTGSFTQDGGTYEMLFVAQANGVSRLPQYSKAVNAMNIVAGDSLATTLKNLENNIRKSYDNYYKCVVAQLENSNTPEATALLKSLCRVEYQIDVESPYDESKYKVSDRPPHYKDTAGCDDKAHINFPANTSIETAINTIMKACPQVRDEMSTGDSSSTVKYEYKVHSAVKSERIQGNAENAGQMKFTVVYRVVRTLSPKAAAIDPAFRILALDDPSKELQSKEYDVLRDSIISFDYIYTGKNIDILDFDMKVNMGLAYLQIATLSNTFKSQRDRAAVTTTNLSHSDALVQSTSGRYGTGNLQVPVFFGKQITHPSLITSSNGGSATQSAFTMAKHASLEAAEATVRITGNDMLLQSTNKNTSPEYMLQRANRPPGEVPVGTSYHNWGYVPSYAKINIKMPRNNDDFALFTGFGDDNLTGNAQSVDYARDFWFDGYYYVYGIDHLFDGGEFSQTLHMISIPKTSAATALKTQPREKSFDVKVTECYDSTIGCGKPPSSNASTDNQARVPSPIQADPASPENKSISANDAATILNAPRSLSQVIGWDDATPAVQAAILNAAQQYGVDATTLAQMCYQESKFNPSAKSPHSSATGLFQFIKDTWDPSSLGGTDSYLTRAVLADETKRLDPQLNAYAGAKYLKLNSSHIGSSAVGDLYLAHFLGRGNGKYDNPNSGAKGVIAYDKSSNGTMTISELFGAAKAEEMAAANKPYIRSNMTVRDMRTWASLTMAKTLKDSNVTPARNAKTPPKQASTTKPVAASTVATPIQEAPRKALDNLAAQQDCKNQDTKNSEPTCADKPKPEPVPSTAAVPSSQSAAGLQSSDPSAPA